MRLTLADAERRAPLTLDAVRREFPEASEDETLEILSEVLAVIVAWNPREGMTPRPETIIAQLRESGVL
jgi:hypothetical protein